MTVALILPAVQSNLTEFRWRVFAGYGMTAHVSRCRGFCHWRRCIRRWLGTVKIAAINQRRARVRRTEQNDKRIQRQPFHADDASGAANARQNIVR
jgi:hypothetical protein